MSEITQPIALDSTLRRVAAAIEGQNAGVSGILLPVEDAVVANDAITISRGTAVYRADAALDDTTATIPFVDASLVPVAGAYYCFELEIGVDAEATTLVGPGTEDGWTWLEGGGLPESGFAGKTIYIACRLDCAAGARTITANVWRVE